MKTQYILLLALVLGGSRSFAQGTLIFDQQSSTDEGLPAYGEGGTMQAFTSPWGQSFTPSLPGVDFIRLMFDDANTSDNLGATLHVDLLSGSISGTVIGTTASITMPNQFRGTATLLFQSTVPLTPGTKYYFQPILETGGPWNIVDGSFSYPGGNAYNAGTIGGGQLWFREGIVAVPEPSIAALLLAGGGLTFCYRRKGQ